MTNRITSFRKVSTVLLTCFIVFVFSSFRSLAAEPTQGTVIVSVHDNVGENFVGAWYLHHGSSEGGFMVRNGSFGERFQAEAGTYFLELRGQSPRFPFYLLYSDNPQILYEGGTITFNVQYFETREQMLTASGQSPVVETPVATTTSQTVNGIIDEHGCNSTKGYAWCAKDQACVKFWSPACKITTIESVSGTTNEITNDSEKVQEPIASTTPSVTEEFIPSASDVPSFETAPVPTEPQDLNVAIEAMNGQHLVQTGSSAGLLLIASMLLSLGMLRLSCTRRQRP